MATLTITANDVNSAIDTTISVRAASPHVSNTLKFHITRPTGVIPSLDFSLHPVAGFDPDWVSGPPYEIIAPDNCVVTRMKFEPNTFSYTTSSNMQDTFSAGLVVFGTSQWNTSRSQWDIDCSTEYVPASGGTPDPSGSYVGESLPWDEGDEVVDGRIIIEYNYQGYSSIETLFINYSRNMSEENY